MSSPDSPLTEYKEFAKWGYSRMFVNGSRSLELRHYAAKIAPDGKGVELPFAVTDVVRLEGL